MLDMMADSYLSNFFCMKSVQVANISDYHVLLIEILRYLSGEYACHSTKIF